MHLYKRKELRTITNHPSVTITVTVCNAPSPKLSDFLRSAYPSKQGLYPHEILALYYAHTFTTDQKTFQGFWSYLYGIEDMAGVLTSLYSRGFLDIGGIEISLSKESVAILRQELRNMNLKISGKKQELIDRLINEVPINRLEKRFIKRYYTITPKGKHEIEEGAYISYVHDNQTLGISIWEMNILMHKLPNPKFGFRDAIWSYLNEMSIKHVKEGNYNSYRNVRLHMYSQLAETNKWKNALTMLAEVIAYDLSGLCPINLFSDYAMSCDYMPNLRYENSMVRIAPLVHVYLTDCRDHLDISEEQLMQELEKAINNISLPNRLFSIDECLKIIRAERKQDLVTLDEIYSAAGARLWGEKAKKGL